MLLRQYEEVLQLTLRDESTALTSRNYYKREASSVVQIVLSSHGRLDDWVVVRNNLSTLNHPPYTRE